MHHEIDFFIPQDSADGRFIAEAQLMEGDPRRHRRAVAIDEIVQHDGAMTRGQQLADTMAADVSGPSDDKDVHATRLVLLSARGWLAISFPNE